MMALLNNQTTMTIRKPAPRVLAAVLEDASQAQLELAEKATVEPMGINYVHLRLHFGSSTAFKSSDVMIWSEDNLDLIVGGTLTTIDSRHS